MPKLKINLFTHVSLNIIFCAITIAFSSCSRKNYHGLNEISLDYSELNENGAWCWFSSPTGLIYNGEKSAAYYGLVDNEGNALISSVDLNSKKYKSTVLHANLGVDDHNVPTILVLPNGKFLVFYNEHSGNVYSRVSQSPENIDLWEEEKVISQKDSLFTYCYTYPVMLSKEDNRIYLFGRRVGPKSDYDNWKFYFRYSEDLGITWSEEVVFLENQGKKNPPYLKVTSDNKGRIDFLFTDGHPKIGSNVSIFHMYLEQGTFFQTDGEVLTDMTNLPINIGDVNRVYDARQSNVRSWIWDFYYFEGVPYVTYILYPSEHDHVYHYAYYSNSEWKDFELINSGSSIPQLQSNDIVSEAHYSAGIAIDRINPKAVILSRNVFGKFELEKWKLLDDKTWQKTLLTNNSKAHNIRPYVISDFDSGLAYVLWMYGKYRHYSHITTGIRMAPVAD